MALSGRILGSFGGASTSQVRPVITWSATQSISGNYSTVTASLVFENYRTDLWTSFNSTGHSVTFTINGNKSTSSRTFNIRNSASTTIWTRTVRVNHSSDGSKSFSLSVSGNTGVRLGSYNFSGTGALTQIPRASTLSAFSFASHLQPNTAVNLNYTIDRKSGSFRHEIQLRDGSHVIRTWDNVSSNGSTSVQLSTANVNSLLNRMSSVTTRSLTLRVRTRSGVNGGWIGSAVTRNATATVNANVKPTVGALSLSQTGNSVSSHYLQGKSKVKASFSRSAGYGASISSSSITVRRKSTNNDVQTINSNDGTTSRAVNLSGTYQARGMAKDSRGRTTYTSWTDFSVTAYSPPRITKFEAVRGSSTETTITVTRSATHTSLGRANSARMLIQKRTGTGAWTTVQDTSDAGGSWNGSVNSTGNSVTSSHDFRATLTDSFGESATVTVTVSTQRVVLDIHKNEGVGIGKIHERGVLDVDGEAYFAGDLFVNGVSTTQLTRLENVVPLGSATDDIAFWTSLPQGNYFVRPDSIPNQPTNWGIMQHMSMAGEFNTIWYGQPRYAMWRKSGNSSSMTNWVLADRPDRGSNSNGNWIRFEDGTQICWLRRSLTYTKTEYIDTTWNYPVSFNSAPILLATGDASWISRKYYQGNVQTNTTNGNAGSVRMWHTQGLSYASGDSHPAAMIAIGRWK